ncbi:uncharacterized protein LOC112685177 [Sipha flava]|uniref:Uncharacterized protein LOC112685177 n=1 Tax=Sipha flava TaxID=143950 RepID=A0A8B8FQH0_9HEMI|nr:uncharacterized protein LOC112685177 [Sipha flava]
MLSNAKILVSKEKDRYFFGMGSIATFIITWSLSKYIYLLYHTRNAPVQSVFDAVIYHLASSGILSNQSDPEGLLDLSNVNIQSKMTVAKNSILQSKNEINYETIKQNISKNVFPNLYKLLQVAII